MADYMSTAEMEASALQYMEERALTNQDRFSNDPAVKAAAETARAQALKAREERLAAQPKKAVDANGPIDFSRVSDEEFRKSFTSSPEWKSDAPVTGTAASVLAPDLLKAGLHPDFLQRYSVDQNGNVPEAIYKMAQDSKAFHFSDPAWMAKVHAGDVDARRTWATLQFILAAGPAPKPAA